MVVQINYRYWSFFKGLLFTFQCALVLQLFAVERFILYHLYFVLSTVFLIFLNYFLYCFLGQNNKLVIVVFS